MFESKDMIFNQSGGGIQSGGLSIKSIMMSKGMSPIMSINTDKDTEGCILLGETWAGGDFIGRSKVAFEAFDVKFSEGLSNGVVTLIIQH